MGATRQSTLDRYYLNPSYCAWCKEVIEVKDHERCSDVRKRRFCNKSCAGLSENARRHGEAREEKRKLVEEKRLARKPMQSDRTKGELFSSRSSWQSARSSIARLARESVLAAGLAKNCKICGYENHTEVCHIESVSSFSDETKISEINRLDNLVYLCPNHHWEFDNGLLDKSLLM